MQSLYCVEYISDTKTNFTNKHTHCLVNSQTRTQGITECAHCLGCHGEPVHRKKKRFLETTV